MWIDVRQDTIYFKKKKKTLKDQALELSTLHLLLSSFMCFFLIQAKWKFHLIKITVPKWSHQSWTQGPLRVRSSTPKPPSKCLRSILNKILKLRPTQTLPIVSLHLLIGNQPNTPKLHSRKPLCLIMEPAPWRSDTGTRCHRVFFLLLLLFFFCCSEESSAEGPVLEGVVSVASVHMNLASVQPQTVATSRIPQEVFLWGQRLREAHLLDFKVPS